MSMVEVLCSVNDGGRAVRTHVLKPSAGAAVAWLDGLTLTKGSTVIICAPGAFTTVCSYLRRAV